jgi:hypothetical protein
MQRARYLRWAGLTVAVSGLVVIALFVIGGTCGVRDGDETTTEPAIPTESQPSRAEFDPSALLAESESIAFRLRYVADPDLPCSGPCMGLKDIALSLRNASARCAKVPRVPTDARSEFLELEGAVRSVCGEIRIALADGKVLEPDNGVSWALPLTEQLDSKLRLANSVR